MSKEANVIEREACSSEDDLLFDSADVSPTYLKKALLASNAIDNIGFGKYQKGLFVVAGFGWFADNAFPVATSYILQRLNEVDKVHYPPGRAPYLTLAQNLGLLAGAFVWSLAADIIGRRWVFSFTFLFTSVFSIVAGASPNFAAAGTFCALWSFGVGGNLPVDSAIFLEALPTNKKWLLTVMSVWWSIGQVVTALISWGLISNYSCEDVTDCHASENKGWRYFMFTLGGLSFLMFLARFLFPVYESPAFYLARGNNARAVETLDKIAGVNGSVNPLNLEELEEIDRAEKHENGDHAEILEDMDGSTDTLNKTRTSAYAATAKIGENQLLRQRLRKYGSSHVAQCFSSRRLALSSTLVIFSWGIIGLAFPLYNAFLPTCLESKVTASNSVYVTYRNALIVAVLGVPGALISGVLVELRIGRKGTLCASCIMTGIVLFGSTTAKSSNSYLAWTCFFNFFSNIMYGVLYAYTPEVFPAKIRGTAVGLAASFNRVFGVFAPIIAMYADLTTSAPIFVSGALFLAAGALVLFYPYEPRNRASL
ncbi:hypothetical protein OXX79_005061 [Metschnikowia pulcherrima]